VEAGVVKAPAFALSRMATLEWEPGKAPPLTPLASAQEMVDVSVPNSKGTSHMATEFKRGDKVKITNGATGVVRGLSRDGAHLFVDTGKGVRHVKRTDATHVASKDAKKPPVKKSGRQILDSIL